MSQELAKFVSEMIRGLNKAHRYDNQYGEKEIHISDNKARELVTVLKSVEKLVKT